MNPIECENCFCSGMSSSEFEDIGSGEDENGEFTDYECLECSHINRPYIEDSNYPEVTVAVKIIAKFNLEYALESLEDEMYEDWLASVMRDISKEDRERIENDLNKYLEARPSYWEGEMVDIEE